MSVVCPYCGRPAKLVTGEVVYPLRREFWSRHYWHCKPCGAYVGCHRGTDRPFGRLADAALRNAKVQAHAAFDPIWKLGHMDRSQAYAWLAEKLGLHESECHIGMFDYATCHQVIEHARNFRRQHEGFPLSMPDEPR